MRTNNLLGLLAAAPLTFSAATHAEETVEDSADFKVSLSTGYTSDNNLNVELEGIIWLNDQWAGYGSLKLQSADYDIGSGPDHYEEVTVARNLSDVSEFLYGVAPTLQLTGGTNVPERGRLGVTLGGYVTNDLGASLSVFPLDSAFEDGVRLEGGFRWDITDDYLSGKGFTLDVDVGYSTSSNNFNAQAKLEYFFTDKLSTYISFDVNDPVKGERPLNDPHFSVGAGFSITN